MGPIFYAQHRLGILRISTEEEIAGLDISSHGGYAYNTHQEENQPRFYADYMRMHDHS